MNVVFPEHIQKIMEILDESGFRPYLVGGCVRDAVMGIVPHDYDITVKASPEDIIRTFESENYRTIPKGRQFGTVGVLANNEVVEITPYRTESDYRDSRHPEKVEFVSDIRLDLSRRDFSVNAMAMNSKGEILDIFGGKEDIKSGIIRCVGNADERFTEDALRILRAIRFAARFGFRLEDETFHAMCLCKKLLHNISAERICSELCGILESKYAFELLCECREITAEIIPGFAPDERLKKNSGGFAYRLFCCIYKNSYESVKGICSFLKLSNADTKKILTLHELFRKSPCFESENKITFGNDIKLLACKINREYLYDIFAFTDSDTQELSNFLDHGIYSIEQLAISGKDIIDTARFPLNATGKVLSAVLSRVCIGELNNTSEAISDFLKNCDFNFYAE